jgi:hypothetical protein
VQNFVSFFANLLQNKRDAGRSAGARGTAPRGLRPLRPHTVPFEFFFFLYKFGGTVLTLAERSTLTQRAARGRAPRRAARAAQCAGGGVLGGRAQRGARGRECGGYSTAPPQKNRDIFLASFFLTFFA